MLILLTIIDARTVCMSGDILLLNDIFLINFQYSQLVCF